MDAEVTAQKAPSSSAENPELSKIFFSSSVDALVASDSPFKMVCEEAGG